MVYKINGYKIRFNPMYQAWQVSHRDISAWLADFTNLNEAIDYCKNG